MRWTFRLLHLLLVALISVILAPVPALAVPGQGLTATEIAEEVAASGRYLEISAPAGLDAAIDRANAGGTVFVWLDSDDFPEDVADQVLDELVLQSTPYRTVLVLTDSGVAASSETVPTPEVDAALDASFVAFRNGDVADGVATFDRSLSGTAATTATTTGGSSSASTPSSNSSGGGIGLGSLLLVALVGGGGFWLFRRIRSGSKARKAVAAEMEADRAEIKEQLRDNADHVLSLGDRAIASGDAELISLYERASATYQEVSQAVDEASTPAEVDALDDRIDEAEWQFETIEARLEGRPAPPSPAEVEARAERNARAAPPPPSGGPALGPEESVLGPGPPPRPPARSRQSGRRRSRGGLGGALGGALGSVILGGGLGGGRSRRSTRRAGSGFPIGGSSRSNRRPSSGGLGGGVLRRGGGSSRRSSSSRGSSGRRFGNRSRGRGRGSRRF